MHILVTQLDMSLYLITSSVTCAFYTVYSFSLCILALCKFSCGELDLKSKPKRCAVLEKSVKRKSERAYGYKKVYKSLLKWQVFIM